MEGGATQTPEGIAFRPQTPHTKTKHEQQYD